MLIEFLALHKRGGKWNNVCCLPCVSKCNLWPLIILNKAVHMLTFLLCLFVILVNYEVGMMQDRTVLKSKNIGFPTVSGGIYVLFFANVYISLSLDSC